jgi:Putative esterase
MHDARTGWLARGAVCAVATLLSCLAFSAEARGALKFEIQFVKEVRAEPADGRVFVMIARTNAAEPRFQTEGYRATPFFGADVDGLRPGAWAVIDGHADGYPLDHLGDLPAGDYWVQGMLNIYTTFHRADGHIVKMHMDRWEGQHFQKSPGNLYSEPKKMHLDPRSGGVVRITLDRRIPPIEMPADTEYVKHVRFESALLSKFWGQPISIGATILLPRGYDRNPAVLYPVDYEQGHFSTAAPGHFGEKIETPAGATPQLEERIREQEKQREEFEKKWLSGGFPRMLYVTFQHPTPYYDDSYAVDSPNMGPYGKAITEELIPYIEKHFRAIPEPYARILSGGSTGGWESLALQIFYPDFFGGTFTYCPDPVDFHYFQIVNIYDWSNAWHHSDGWTDVPLPGERDIDGLVLSTMEQQLKYERALGSHGRSGEQWDVWEAAYGPLGDDGYFKPLFDPETGAIDHGVAAYWRDHMDLTVYLQKHWNEIGPKLAGKIHIWVGDMDSFYLNDAVHLLEAYLDTTKDPPYGGSIVYGPRKPHCWAGPESLAGRLEGMGQSVAAHAPRGESLDWWKPDTEESRPEKGGRP